MSITLLNVSWKAEELLNIALLLVQNLFCLPSLSLKIALGLGFVFPFFVFYPVPGICPWDLLVKDILCQHLVTGHTPVWSEALRSSTSLLCLCPCLQYEEQNLCLSQENCCTGMWILLLSPGHFVWLYQAQRNCNSDLLAKYVLEVASSTEANYPCVHYWCFLKFRVSLNFLHTIILLMAYTDTRFHGSVIFWCRCKSNYFSSSKHVCVSESYIQRNTVQH